jgi:hypothetical protein
MAFSDFKTVFDVSAKFGTKIDKANLFPSVPPLQLTEAYLDDLKFAMQTKKPNPSEISLSENFIAPMLRYVTRRHYHITYWSREYFLKVDEVLSGTPDYLFSYTESPTAMMMGMPLICVAEAKVDDFVGAWGQALAEMIACQQLFPDLEIYGFTTNGTTWEFGKLEKNRFLQELNSYSISTQAPQIAGILDWIFTEVVSKAEQYMVKHPAKAWNE